MCTLSWLLHNNGYEMFFNRDEQRSREKARPPSTNSKLHAIMPIDPQGKGTWIASHQTGMSLCLLNNYAKQTKITASNVSRGQLIPQLLGLNNFKDIFKALTKLELTKYQSFFLCVFPAGTCLKHSNIQIIEWDGTHLSKEHASQPVISSVVSLNQVTLSRSMVFMQGVLPDETASAHLDFHSSHLPEKGSRSVCMHREDARTQSLSHIAVNSRIVFRYFDGPPCLSKEQAGNWSEVQLTVSTD